MNGEKYDRDHPSLPSIHLESTEESSSANRRLISSDESWVESTHEILWNEKFFLTVDGALFSVAIVRELLRKCSDPMRKGRWTVLPSARINTGCRMSIERCDYKTR
jgi:hypothetical protein